MENKNIKRINETLKEIAEAQQDTVEFNRDIEMDIDKINQALLYGDFMQKEECRCDIVRKYPNYAHYLDNRAFLLNLIVYDPTIILGIQKIALSDIKSNSATLKALVEEAKDNNTKTENRLNEGILILLARMCAARPIVSQNAFLKMLGAIRCALDIDHKEDGYGWMLKELEEYMLMLNNGYPFSGSSDEIPQKVQAYKDIYKEDDDLIRKHKNYYLIKDMYEPLMGRFDIRLKLISQMKPVSLTEVDKTFENSMP